MRRPCGDDDMLARKRAPTDHSPADRLQHRGGFRQAARPELAASHRPFVRLHHRHAIRAKPGDIAPGGGVQPRTDEHTSELQSLLRISYAVFCWKNKTPH